MKGKIEKFSNGYYISKSRVYSDEDYMVIETEDMDEFMDDIYSQYLKKKHRLLNLIERTAMEAVKVRKEQRECEKDEAHREGYRIGYERGYDQALLDVKNIARGRKVVITPEEEAEQDKDELEMDSETKTHNNFPTDEAIEYDINVREKD